jgi:hypothetical protein
LVEPALGVCSVESLTQLAFMVLATTDKPQVGALTLQQSLNSSAVSLKRPFREP